jgi:hypothetical protein
MSNVIPFRTKKSELQKKLLQQITDLQEIYDGLDMAGDATFKLQQVAEQAEEEYNIMLRNYVDEVGAENVELGYLEYTTDIAVVFEGGDVSIKFVYNPQQLNLFSEDD